MKQITKAMIISAFAVFMLNCQNTPNPSTSSPKPTSSPSAAQLEWTDSLVSIYKTKCEQELNADKTTVETIDIKGACQCTADQIKSRFTDGAQRFTGDAPLSSEDQKALEEIGKDCALKNIKPKP